MHEIGCPLCVLTGVHTQPVIGYGHGYAQCKRAGDGRVHFRFGTGTGTGTGGNIEEAGELQGYTCQSQQRRAPYPLYLALLDVALVWAA